MEQYPFQTVRHLIAYYVWKNPARARYPNLLENESSGAPPAQFSGQHPQDIYSSVIHAIRVAVKKVDDKRSAHYFAEAYIGDRINLTHPKDIAKKYGVSERTVNRGIRRILDELEREMIRRGLIDPEIIASQNRFK